MSLRIGDVMNRSFREEDLSAERGGLEVRY